MPPRSNRPEIRLPASAGAMALTGDPRRVAWEPGLMPGVVHFLDPYRYRSTFHRTTPDISEAEFCQDYLNHLEEIIRYEGPETIAAILIESVTGTNGIIIPPEVRWIFTGIVRVGSA